jgi:hypothetical protein
MENKIQQLEQQVQSLKGDVQRIMQWAKALVIVAAIFGGIFVWGGKVINDAKSRIKDLEKTSKSVDSTFKSIRKNHEMEFDKFVYSKKTELGDCTNEKIKIIESTIDTLLSNTVKYGDGVRITNEKVNKCMDLHKESGNKPDDLQIIECKPGEEKQKWTFVRFK